jgi:hypothetical protein
MARIADDDCVGWRGRAQPQASLGGCEARERGEAERPLVLTALPDRFVQLDYL